MFRKIYENCTCILDLLKILPMDNRDARIKNAVDYTTLNQTDERIIPTKINCQSKEKNYL